MGVEGSAAIGRDSTGVEGSAGIYLSALELLACLPAGCRENTREPYYAELLS